MYAELVGTFGLQLTSLARNVAHLTQCQNGIKILNIPILMGFMTGMMTITHRQMTRSLAALKGSQSAIAR